MYELKKEYHVFQKSLPPQRMLIPQLTRPQYQFVHSDQPPQIKFAPHFTETNYHTPSKTTCQITGGIQGKKRPDTKMGYYKMGRVCKVENDQRCEIEWVEPILM